MIRKIIILLCVLACPLLLHAQDTITGYEYWTDPDDRTYVSLSGPGGISGSLELDLVDLVPGIYDIHLRFRQINGAWSPLIRKSFLKLAAGEASRDVQYCEFWVDDHFAERDSADIPDGGKGSLLLDMSGIDAGPHVLHLRFLDNAGLYSPLQTYYIHVLSGGGEKQIVGYEYWLDGVFAERTFVPVEDTSALRTTLIVDLTHVDPGAHELSIRFMDNAGKWSAISKKWIRSHMPGHAANMMDRYRYWFNDEYDSIRTEYLLTPIEVMEWTHTYDVTRLATDTVHTVHFQFGDVRGLWSPVVSDTFNVIAVGLEDPARPETWLKAYPNPATEYLFVEMPTGAGEQLSLNMYDMNGRPVLHREFLLQAAALHRIMIDLRRFSPGTYILEGMHGKRIERQQIIIPHR